LQSKADYANMCKLTYLRSSDLDLDVPLLPLCFYLDVLKMYRCTKNKVSRSRLSKVGAQTAQTHRRDRTRYTAAFACGNKLELGVGTVHGYTKTSAESDAKDMGSK